MEFDRIRLMEHLTVDCQLTLVEFCEAMQRLFGLPDFEYDCENETEWGLVNHGGIEYNVSRPYERGTLEEWDGSVPAGCNVGLTLTAFVDCSPGFDPDWSSAELVERVGQALADLLRCRVYHHRTWLESSKNVTHKRVFQPNQSSG